MSSECSSKPEEHELAAKREQLVVLEEELADRERELATMQAAIHAFERGSKAQLEPRYEELANLRMQISELLARFNAQRTPAQAKSPPAPVNKRAPAPRHKKRRPASPEARPLPPSTPKELAERLKRLDRDV